MSLDRILADLSTDAVRRHIEHIATEIPSRLAGSRNGRRMAEYSAQALQEAGLAARIESCDGAVSFPADGALTLLLPEGAENFSATTQISATTLGHSTSTPPEGIEAELIDTGGGGFADYEGQDAAGRIVLSELSYHPARHEKQRIAALKGAAGCVMMNWGPPDSTALPFGSVKPAWGNPTPRGLAEEMATLPCIGISRADGMRLRERLRQGPLRVRLQATAENAWRPVHITVGELPAPGEDFVLLGGHQDSWWGPQATDNAAGNACMLELARVFAAHRASLRRGLVCGFWAGHETGTMIGSARFAERHWDRLRRHAVAYMQIDQPACLGTTTWSSSSNLELKDFVEAVTAGTLPDRDRRWHAAGKMGDASFFGLGLPMFGGQGNFTPAELAATAGASLGWWHHSVHNTLDKMEWPAIGAHLQVYARWLWALCTDAVLPFAYAAVADSFAARLATLLPQAAGLGLHATLAAATGLQAAARTLDAAAQSWRARYAAEPALDAAPAEALNACFRRLSRRLVPLASTAAGPYGQDMYGYTPQTTMIPLLYDIAAYAAAPPGSEAKLTLETALLRARNAVTDGLADSIADIEATLAALPR